MSPADSERVGTGRRVEPVTPREAQRRDEQRRVAAAEARAISQDPVDLAELRAIALERAELHVS